MKIMKKLFMALVAMLIPLSAIAANATLSIEDFNIKAGETKDMVIDLSNPSNEITLVQFDLRLPNGLSVRMDGSEYAMEIVGRTSYRKHSLDANATEGIIRFLLSSTKNTALEGTNGAIIGISLTAASSFKGGTIRLENILLVTPDEKEVKPADVEFVIGGETPTPGSDWHDGDEFTAKTIEGIDMRFKVLSAKDKTCQVGVGNESLEEGTISSRNCAVSPFTRMGIITIPQTANGFSVVKIADGAFYNVDVNPVVLPESITSIGANAFCDCESLKEINLPNSLQYLGDNAFDGCIELEEITIPLNCTLGSYIFDYCFKLKSIYSRSENPTEAPNAFVPQWSSVNIYNQATLYVPAGTKGKYQATSGWKNFKNIVEVGGEPTPQTSAYLSIEPFSIKAGEKKEMVIDLTNPEDEITLVQFDLRLPTGLSLKMDGDEYAMEIAGRTTYRKHSLDANATDGIIRFLLSSTKNTALEGTSGAIIKMTLVADGSYAGGEIRLENILLVTPDEKEIKPNDISSLGISDVMVAGRNKTAIYTLSGQRLAAPRKGINIINGKKVVVK